jgi:nitrate/TMAO reductase-like tetraheme cytochrome c subunit
MVQKCLYNKKHERQQIYPEYLERVNFTTKYGIVFEDIEIRAQKLFSTLKVKLAKYKNEIKNQGG